MDLRPEYPYRRLTRMLTRNWRERLGSHHGLAAKGWILRGFNALAASRLGQFPSGKAWRLLNRDGRGLRFLCSGCYGREHRESL